MNTLVILSLLLVTLYLGAAIWRMKCLPDSISATVFVFKYKWLWTVWMWSVSALTLIPAIDRLSHIGMEALGFGSLACLVFCGAMPLVDKDNTKKHWTFGISGSILTQICVYFIYYECLWVWVLFPFFFLSSYIQPNGWLGKAMNGKGVLIAEIICYICLVSSNLT